MLWQLYVVSEMSVVALKYLKKSFLKTLFYILSGMAYTKKYRSRRASLSSPSLDFPQKLGSHIRAGRAVLSIPSSAQ